MSLILANYPAFIYYCPAIVHHYPALIHYYYDYSQYCLNITQYSGKKHVFLITTIHDTNYCCLCSRVNVKTRDGGQYGTPPLVFRRRARDGPNTSLASKREAEGDTAPVRPTFRVREGQGRGPKTSLPSKHETESTATLRLTFRAKEGNGVMMAGQNAPSVSCLE